MIMVGPPGVSPQTPKLLLLFKPIYVTTTCLCKMTYMYVEIIVITCCNEQSDPNKFIPPLPPHYKVNHQSKVKQVQPRWIQDTSHIYNNNKLCNNRWEVKAPDKNDVQIKASRMSRPGENPP